MKKYIIPETIVVELRMKTVVLQTSNWDDTLDNEIPIEDPDEILTKGVVNSRNVWEEEW
ncbi:MAG: hypothetical protein IJ826_04445 [Bacteroidaceae bacterium]|nr:hypothetical protein [Bacteroidaceae bacterium]